MTLENRNNNIASDCGLAIESLSFLKKKRTYQKKCLSLQRETNKEHMT